MTGSLETDYYQIGMILIVLGNISAVLTLGRRQVFPARTSERTIFVDQSALLRAHEDDWGR